MSGQGLLAVGFDHQTSREGDPLLHTHLVIANRVQDRTVSEEVASRLFDRLAGSDGLTEHASTFSRPEVLVALGAGLAGATRTQLEDLADRFVAERAVSVVADRAAGERRWSTPDLLAVEQRLVTSATGRTGEHTAVVSHQAVGEALATHTTAGADQQAMVCDLCRGGQGVAVVVGRAGTGKTFALGIARRAWQLDGYRLLAAAPTGIATMSLQGEGFEDVAHLRPPPWRPGPRMGAAGRPHRAGHR